MSYPRSAIPTFYYVAFGLYEPALTTLGFLGTMADPVRTHNSQAPWPSGIPAPAVLPLASMVTIVQLAHVCALLGFVNFFILGTVRRHLAGQPAIQEKIVGALLTPLLVGDIAHLAFTIWALGDERWVFSNWSGMLWITVVLGLTLLIPRVAWHMGVGRYVNRRDGKGALMQ
ncbi:hypothetical protein FA95DRAFT_1552895 [Auriscalpium vulgare]|uniref:Uncharacterized protein n=1 Tax=Auriscalpium vulgare TaxID=40419 RepID=A0ACB8S943_9AGAM|nr:hypothetical protein FA95DRAFT_1552895 [Auriscalpium vulgare]